MDKFRARSLGKELFYSLALAAAFLAVAPACQASVNRGSIRVDITTTDRNWYVSNGSGLHSYVVCDDGSSPDYSKYVPCDSKFNGGNYYYSDDLKDANNSAAPSKNFKIYASASSSGSSMKSVRIEFKNGGSNPPGSWGDAKGYTCSGSSCEVCHESGSCAHKIIPLSMLNVKSNGDQNEIWIRVIFTDNSSSNNTVTTGYDTGNHAAPYADKMYKYSICGKACGGSDYTGGTTPTPTPDPATDPTPEPEPEPEDPCLPNDLKPTAATVNAININNYNLCLDLRYRLFWSFTDPNGAAAYYGGDQSRFEIELREFGTASPLYYYRYPGSYNQKNITLTPEIMSSMRNGEGGPLIGLTFQYGKKYEWRVRVTDSDGRTSCVKTSDWSAWSGIGTKGIVTPAYDHPKPVVSVRNDSGAICTDGLCAALDNFNFSSAGTQTYSPSTYQWYISNEAGSYVAVAAPEGQSTGFRKQVLLPSAKQFKVRLGIRDVLGTTCYDEKTIVFDVPSVIWNEITPK